MKITIETVDNDNNPKIVTFETPAMVFAALGDGPIDEMPGDIRSGFLKDVEAGNFSSKHMIGLLAGAMQQPYDLLPRKKAENLIRTATMVAETASLAGITRRGEI